MNFFNQKGELPKKEFCEKINNVNNEVCSGVIKECYKNIYKCDSSRQLVKTIYLRCQTCECQTDQCIRKKIHFLLLSLSIKNLIVIKFIPDTSSRSGLVLGTSYESNY